MASSFLGKRGNSRPHQQHTPLGKQKGKKRKVYANLRSKKLRRRQIQAKEGSNQRKKVVRPSPLLMTGLRGGDRSALSEGELEEKKKKKKKHWSGSLNRKRNRGDPENAKYSFRTTALKPREPIGGGREKYKGTAEGEVEARETNP